MVNCSKRNEAPALRWLAEQIGRKNNIRQLRNKVWNQERDHACAIGKVVVQNPIAADDVDFIRHMMKALGCPFPDGWIQQILCMNDFNRSTFEEIAQFLVSSADRCDEEFKRAEHTLG